jgi:lipopolysaccharide export system ATP-binding protein
MSYTDERDELAELFSVKDPKRKPGYSDEIEEPATPAKTASAAPAQARPAAASESHEVKKPVKLRPPADVAPHPLELPPTRPVTSLSAAAAPPKPVPPAPVVEDEEFLFDAGDLPDFSDLDFLPLEKSAPVKTKSAPPIDSAAPASVREDSAPAPAPADPPPQKPEPASSSVAALKPAPAPPQRSRTRPATNKADLHFESDASLVHSDNDHFLLDTHGLVKIYDGRTVVNGVDINVRAGEIVGLLGPNGAGKTTSFYMIVGLVPPNGGQVLFNGNDVTTMPMYQRARLGMGYLPQEESIFRKLTVEENIMAVMETLDLPRKVRQERCNELLERFSITHIRKNIALTCSGGEKRRLTIARSLVTTPSLLMLDEPFSGVDPIAVNEIQNIVEDLRKSGLAILITDHNARQTLELVDRAYLIYEGKVLREGTRDFLINDPVSRELYLGDRFTM